MGIFGRRKQTPPGPTRLHVGCGTEVLDGWCNIDLQELPGVDLVLDVTRGFDFANVEYIFCEHFIEHLRLDAGIRFLHACCAALRPGGVLRLSTPNLDWVWITHYAVEREDAGERIADALTLNRAFHGWGHQFLYNAATLKHVLRGVGFADIAECSYGESPHPGLRGLERHERSGSTPDHPDVIVLEATRGASAGSAAELEQLLAEARERYLRFLDWELI